MLNKGQNDEECDATDDHNNNIAGLKKLTVAKIQS